MEKLLAAEKANDHSASFSYVDPSSATTAGYVDIAAWSLRRRELPPITGYTVTASGDGGAAATVDHAPKLDAFYGLAPAHERQVWKGVRTSGGWLVVAEPEVTPVLPSDDAAGAAVSAWVRAVQSCDRAKAVALQAVDKLYGSSQQAATLCHSSGDVRVGAVTALVVGPGSTDIVAQYGTDALTWARTVPVLAPARVLVIVAPIGDEWKVLGIADPS